MKSALLIALVMGAPLADVATGPIGRSPGPYEGLEHARRPQRLASLWAGLPPKAERASVARIVTLRPPLERRIRITGVRFAMGSTTQEMQEALQLCARETLGVLCQRNDEHVWNVVLTVRAEGHAHEVTVSDFELDATEVTVERYWRCVATGGCSPPSFTAGDPRYDVPGYPITHVTWQDAQTFCRWEGGRLPTEAEWELAARGPKNRTFPWGEIYSPRLANHGAYAEEPSDGRDGFVGLAPVGSFPDGATPTGLLDMAGNAAEWVFDWYERDEQQFGYRRGAQTNPKGPAFGPYGHVVRGGSYRDGAYLMRGAARRASNYASREVGFRCARDLP